jgi:hypothetical protein
MKRLGTAAAAALVVLALTVGLLQLDRLSGPGVWSTWQGKSIEVRGEGISLNAIREHADIEAHGHRVRITETSIIVNGRSMRVPRFRKVVVVVTPAGVSVAVDGKPLPSA